MDGIAALARGLRAGSEFATKKAMSDDAPAPKQTLEIPETALDPPTEKSAAEPEPEAAAAEPAPKKVAATVVDAPVPAPPADEAPWGKAGKTQPGEPPLFDAPMGAFPPCLLYTF